MYIAALHRCRIIRVRQHDITDCGAACLYSVARHYGYSLPIARIRQLAGTDQHGTSVLGMVEAATRLGFVAKGVKGPLESLAQVPKPAVAHLLVRGTLHHFVVIYRVSGRHVTLMDPADGGVHRVPLDRFAGQWTGVLVLLAPGDTFQPRNESISPTRRFWLLIRPHRAVLVEALAGAVATTLLGLSTAVYVQKLVDHVLVGGNRNLLNALSMAMLGLLVARLLIGWIQDLMMLRTGQKIDAALILGYYHHLLRLPQRFFDTTRVGELISRVNDAVRIRAFINDAIVGLTVSLLVVVFSLALMMLYSMRLTLVVLMAIPIYAMVFVITNRINRANQRQLMERAADLESQLVESLGAISTIKRCGIESFSALRTEVRLVRLLRPVFVSGKTALFAGNTCEFISRLTTLLVLWIGAAQVLQRSLSPGELMSFYALIGYLTGPLGGLITANRTVQDALIAADRLFEITDLEVEDRTGVSLTSAMLGDIQLEDVEFGYGFGPPVFRSLTLHIPAGRITAVVGESGSGKSTLAALLQKIHRVERGQIRIGAVDLRHVSASSLREVVGVVPQTVELLAGSVIENIALGEIEPDLARVVQLCEELGIAEFVERLPGGLNTQLGEGGASLSGGQRQRLAIARALYRDPRILILDEATSSLDSRSEQFIQQVLQRLRAERRTVIVIAHRLSTVVHADKIAVLDRGVVAEEGTHHELMLREGIYYWLWQQQFPPPAAWPVPAAVVPPAPPPHPDGSEPPSDRRLG